MELRSGVVVGFTPASPAWPRMTQEGISMFGEGIRMCLSRWTALDLAVNNEWGGRSSRQKSIQLESDILVWFVQSKVPRYIDELEQLLDENMLELFNTQAEDDSVQEVAEQLMILYEECAQGKYDTVHSLAASASQSRHAVRQSQKVVDENGDDDDSDDDLINGQEQDLSASLGLQWTGMEVDCSPAPTRSVAPKEDNERTLTEEEMSDGWQAAPTRSRRRGGRRNVNF